MANRLRKHRHSSRSQRVRYAETHFSSNKSLLSGQFASLSIVTVVFKENSFFIVFLEPVDAAETVRRAEVLVPNTCEYDSPGKSPPAHVLSFSPGNIKKFINLCEHLLTFTDLAHATFVTVFSNKMGVNICLSSKCNIRKSNYSREVTTNVLINVFLPKTD